MKIFIINGDCIQKNSSANLCHLAYIRGFLSAGHDVTLLSADGRDHKLDPSMTIPESVKHHTIYATTFYEKFSFKKGSQANTPAPVTGNGNSDSSHGIGSLIHKITAKCKSFVLSCYGIHGIYSKFIKKANSFKSNEHYDYVISLSTPVTSHIVAHNLLKNGNIKADHWIQIWEDPWYSDAYGFNGDIKVHQEEKRILSYAEKICYVSPLTLQNQQKLYPDSAQKMYWQPLPYYYKNDLTVPTELKSKKYGYFGDYAPASRDLKPFYLAAVEMGINLNICGNPSNLFESTDTINIHPRLPLDKLKPIEDSTNVLVFLCNRKGGQIPGKIYQYSATDKIVLFILDGTDEEKDTLYKYFSQFNRYVFCENNVEDIKRAINQIENNDFGSIENKPTEYFSPISTVEKILNMK